MAWSGAWSGALATLLLLLAGGLRAPAGAEGAKVLGLFQLPGYSHFVMFEALMRELAARGHEVTVVSHFPQKTPLANYTDLSLKGEEKTFVGGFTVEQMLGFNLFTLMRFLWKINIDTCLKAMEHPNMQKVIHSEERYDLIILETFAADCCYGVAWKLGAPVVSMTSLARMPWGQFRMGNPDNPAYNPLVYTPYFSRMSFWQRLYNTAALVFTTVGERLVAHSAMEDLNRRLFGPEVPPLDDLLYNTSLVFLNSHFSLNEALPYVPGIVEVGGIHVTPAKELLPKAVGAWLDGAGAAGAVYVSFGSLVRAEQMPLPQLRAVAAALGALPQRVLWKCEGRAAAQRLGRALPDNVLADNWMQQASVLDHPKVKVFLSHGGLMGTQEALHRGVPMIVVPLFSDQEQNANLLEEKGMARKLYFDDITEESLGKALRDLLHEPSYLENARRLSALFRDRPRPPLQEAVFWSEYVMRHAGAPHLRSAAVRLRWWQHWLLDVAAAALAALAAILAAGLLLFRLLCRVLCRRERRDKVKRS